MKVEVKKEEKKQEIKYKDLPRKAKKAVKRKFMSTIDPAWRRKDVKIKLLRVTPIKKWWDYKSYSICSYTIGF